MSSCERTSAARMLAPLVRGLGVAAMLVTAGCSADVTRFNLLGSTFLGSAPASSPAPSSVAYAPTARGRPTNAPWDGSGMQETALPPLSPSQDYRVVGRDYPPVPAAAYPRRTEPLAKAPDRASPPWTDSAPPPWTDRDPLPGTGGPGAKSKGAPAAQQPATWQGRHTMQSGDSLYAIAKRHKVSVDELKRVNGITDSAKVWAGKVLVVPERPGVAASRPAAPIPPRVVQVTPRVVGPAPEPAAAPEAAPKTAKHDGRMTDAVPAPAVAAGKFRWPARGKIVVGFGTQPDGTKNEGINLAVPLGTDIHAAEAGRVHYVGDGLKGYGNLILIRHANDWVTAYAHADQILVKANDEVRRGQVIGKAGKTGPVAQPQLRFELRKGSVPVDPVPHLAN